MDEEGGIAIRHDQGMGMGDRDTGVQNTGDDQGGGTRYASCLGSCPWPLCQSIRLAAAAVVLPGHWHAVTVQVFGFEASSDLWENRVPSSLIGEVDPLITADHPAWSEIPSTITSRMIANTRPLHIFSRSSTIVHIILGCS